MTDWAGFAFNSAMSLIKLAMEIAEIVKEKGVTEAGKVRLEDIPSWKEWSAQTLKDERKEYFINRLMELRAEMENE